MDDRLARLIADYQAAVRTAVALMRDSGVALPDSNMGWALNRMDHRGVLAGGIPYFKHGYGCAVTLPGGVVDFDFGEHGQIDGFDAWRLTGFAGPRLGEYGFADEAALKACFHAEVAAGSLVGSGYILYYLAN